MKIKAVWIVFLLCVFNFDAKSANWKPELNFTIENSDQNENLLFLSGLTYGLEYSNKALLLQGKSNIFCFPMDKILDLQIVISLLNRKLEGNQSSEAVVSALMIELVKEFPCKN